MTEFVDLGHFLTLLQAKTSDTEIKAAITPVLAAF